MIEAQDLRIGNLVNYEGKYFFIWSEITKYSVDLDDKETKHVKAAAFDELEPIAITEEWLTKKFIFKQIDKYTFVLNGIFIHKRLSGFIFNIGKRKIKLNSIHQLQNLYFALTQKELTLNE